MTDAGELRCPLCGGPSRHWLSRSGRDLRRCLTCRHGWVPQGLALIDGRSIYEHDAPIFLRDGNAEYYLDPGNLANARDKVEWLLALGLRGNLLDVGANFGHFAAAAASDFTVHGLEPSAVAVEWARAHLDVRIETGSVYDERPDFHGRFDVITMWDVIEHLPDPTRALANLRGWLKPGGVLCLSTPAMGSAVARLMGRHWHYLDLVQHVALFDRRNVSTTLRQAGFTPRAVRSFGRLYTTQYVVERARYLGRERWPWRVAAALLRPAAAVAPRQVRVDLGDVMAVAAEAVS